MTPTTRFIDNLWTCFAPGTETGYGYTEDQARKEWQGLKDGTLGRIVIDVNPIPTPGLRLVMPEENTHVRTTPG